MNIERKQPADIARRLAARGRGHVREVPHDQGSGWRRETFQLPRAQARAKAQEWFDRFPKAAYMTEVEFWRVLPDDVIEFTLRRLPTAD